MNFFDDIKILLHHGKQFIPDVTAVKMPEPSFRGRPEISEAEVDQAALAAVCPTDAIMTAPVRLDLGKCTLCGECAMRYPEKIKFFADYKIASNTREGLIVHQGQKQISLDANKIRSEIKKYFKNSLKLRQVSAAGDNSTEWELNASSNPNFDMGRFGIEFVASPRHADGIVISGPISENMAEALQICYDAIPAPKLVILTGVDAISGGIFEGSPALKRDFLEKYPIDLYVPGNPPHPLTFINGILEMMRAKNQR